MTHEVKALGFNEILGTAFTVTRNHFLLLVGMIALTVAPELFVKDPKTLPIGAAAGVLVYLFVTVPWGVAAASFAIGELYRGRTVTMGDALGRAWKSILPLCWTYLLIVLG